MDAEKALSEGDLETALQLLQAQVRSAPADAKLRVFLFQLLAVLGRWDKAGAQLRVAADLDAGNLPMDATYREAVKAEVARADVFAGRRDPVIFGEPAEWIALLFEALRIDQLGHPDQAQALRSAALEAAPASSGRADNTTFDWIADADSRLGPLLEAVLNGRYTWIPFQRIARLRFEEPADLRDLVWTPAQITWTNGGEAVVLIPTRYPGSAEAEDANLRLARRTEWTDLGGDLFAGLGQRMLITDSAEYPLLSVREILLDGADAPGGEPTDG